MRGYGRGTPQPRVDPGSDSQALMVAESPNFKQPSAINHSCAQKLRQLDKDAVVFIIQSLHS